MTRRTLVIAVLILAAPLAAEEATTAEQSIAEARRHWEKMEIAPAVAAWRRARELDPENAEAKEALARVQPVFEGTDEFMDLVEELVDTGRRAEAWSALDRWRPAHVSRDQQARALILKGRLRIAEGAPKEAVVDFGSAETLAESPETRLRARLGRGQALRNTGAAADALELLEKVAAEAAGTDLADEAAWTCLRARDLEVEVRRAELERFAETFPRSPRVADVHIQLAVILQKVHGRMSREAIEEYLAAFAAATTPRKRAAVCGLIAAAIPAIDDAATLVLLADRLAALPPSWKLPVPPRELAAKTYLHIATIDRGERAITAAQMLAKTARKICDARPGDARQDRWLALEAQGLLMEGQLLLLEGREVEALEALSRASAAYEAALRRGDRATGPTLLRIGQLLESRGRPDGAAHHYALVARSFAAEQIGANALWRLAMIYRDRLDRPLEAIAVLKRYQDLYPPSFRVPTTAEDRLRKLGYPDVTAFQAAHGLKVDGVIGPVTLEALREEEENFREILPVEKVATPVRGRFVQDAIFSIAAALRSRGRFREAVMAYQEFLGSYPGHRLGDDALLAVARIFRETDLFDEAIAAYERLIVDYPKGDGTSHAYLEAAHCHECLGQWRRAESLYDLFLKKFPRYRRADEARAKLAALRKLIRYADIVDEGGLAPAKEADARYEMARLLYKEMDNRQKAVEIFTAVADRFAETYHGPDARFSAGVCLLHEGNFAEARDAFAKLVANHPESRLADDGQFWIGHTYEYQARAIGKLDRRRIVLKERSARETDRLRADLALRGTFCREPRADIEAWHRPHPSILRAGRTREKVRDDLQSAIAAYRKVVADHRLGDMAQKSLLRIGAIYSDYLNDPDRAIEAYRELLEKYPGSPEAVDAQFAVGRHFLEKGDLAKAERAIRQFLTSFPNHGRAADAILDLAECHRKQREWVKALDDYQSFLARYPRDPRAEKVRGEIEWLKKYRF